MPMECPCFVSLFHLYLYLIDLSAHVCSGVASIALLILECELDSPKGEKHNYEYEYDYQANNNNRPRTMQ